MSGYEIQSTEYAGAFRVRIVDYTIEDYQGGETLMPAMVGMNRFQSVQVNVADGSAQTANFHRDLNLIRVFDDAGELADGSESKIRLIVFGR